jgi:subtilase family serine protease
MHRRRLAAAIAVGLLVLVPLSSMPAGAATRATLKGSTPTWANSRNLVRAADPSTRVGFRVYLGWRNHAAAEAAARAVSDPKSASYGRYMTPAQFRKQFSPTQAAVGAVQSWLKSQGFAVDYTPANNHYVAADGTLAQAAAAFGTRFNVYKVKGKFVQAPAGQLTIPANLAGTPAISIPSGLDDEGLPVGLQITAPVLEESRLLRVANALEAAIGFSERPKLVASVG